MRTRRSARLWRVTVVQHGNRDCLLPLGGVAFLEPDAAKYFWLLLIPLGFIRDRFLHAGSRRAAGE